MAKLKFDTLVETTLKEIYCEMVGAPVVANSTQLNPTETAAVDDAIHTVTTNDPTAPPTSEEKRLADLASRRKSQLQQATQPAAQKLQTAIAQPIQR